MVVVDSHKLIVFYLKSFDMDSAQVGKAVLFKEIYTIPWEPNPGPTPLVAIIVSVGSHLI